MKTATELLDPTDASFVPSGDVAHVAPPARAGRFADYVELTKPRMNFLVLITTAVGFYMAARGWSRTETMRFIHTLFGTALTAAGASLLNQYMEREHDKLMPRTAARPLPTGRVAPLEALSVGVLCATVGVLYLWLTANALTAALGALTFGTYVFLYTPMKRFTTLCTIVGAIPGAIPPLMGWAAAVDGLSPQAWALFGILFFWQLPHFLAIAILYRDDYAAGGFKMLPVVDPDLGATGRQIVVWGMALIPVSLLPTLMGLTGGLYFVAAAILGVAFLATGVVCAIRRRRIDARRLFFASIFYLPALVAVMVLNKV